MLANLYIKNFALIEEVEIEFQKGFNILTGETGAGKSILIDAVNLVLGGRGCNEFIRSGADKTQVSAVFDISGMPLLQKELADAGIEFDEDMALQLSRELTNTGKNTCRINGRMVNLSLFKDISQYLIDIHGQHDHHSLLHPEKHLDLLDSYGTSEVVLLKAKVKELYSQFKEKLTMIQQITGGEKDRARQRDIYQFQLNEIDQASLFENEDIKLEDEKKIIANAEKLSNLSHQAYVALYAGNNYPSAIDQLKQSLHNLQEIVHIDDSMSGILEIIEGATYQIEDKARDLRGYSDKIEFDPLRLEVIEARLDLIKNLKRKYGDTLEEISRFRDQVAAELEIIDSGDEQLAHLKEQADKLKNEYNKQAAELTKQRKKTATRLEMEIGRELEELLIPQVQFKIDFKEIEETTIDGHDQIEFTISPNLGEPLKPLSKIASGGELSRIMLALKTILARLDEIPTLIFDEIDTGLGGRAAHSVAEKLARLGKERQVICVTHSPQVASFGQNHLYINKETDGQRTLTKIKVLPKNERIEEIARMLGGKEVTELTVQHAREMLENAL